MSRTITALTLQKRNRQRVNVFLDGEYAFGLARIVAAWLVVGQELSDEKINQLQLDDEREVDYQRALRVIQYRPRSESEIRQLLGRHSVPEERAQEVIDRLKQNGLINDGEFAQAWVENRSELHPRSRRALAYELSRRGVDAQVIEQSLEEIDDEAMAYQAAQRPARKYKDLEWNEFRQKLVRYLAQRGFNYSTSAQTIEKIWQEMHDEESIPEEEEGFFMTIWTFILIELIALPVLFFLGSALGYYYKQSQYEKLQLQQKVEAEHTLEEAKEQARLIEIQARDQALQVTHKAEGDIERRRSEINKEEDRLQKRREELDLRLDRLEKREQTLNKRQSLMDKRANEIDNLHEQQTEELQRISQMSTDEARSILLAEVEKDARSDMARIIRQVEVEAREEGETRARKLIVAAIQRVATDNVVEVTTSVVEIPSDEMKGRIIGRNGRNIHAFEQAAGVDVIVDDTPEAVTISCFDPVRREVARRALAKLIQDGRIHPAHIEKVLKNEQKEVDRAIIEAGEQAVYEAGVPGMHPEIIKVLGRLKYRTSYGQNQLAHAVETAKLAAVIAAELGADVEVARTGALLHDLGKAIDYNMEGTHAQLGAEIAKRYGMSSKVVNAIASHHHEVEQETVEAAIVEAADAISGARPGARRESLEQYIKRVRALEEIANSHKGVTQSYALQAGREIRIFVKPEEIDDLASIQMARDIAKSIEESMQYPGQIKVTVIRETRAVDYAK